MSRLIKVSWNDAEISTYIAVGIDLGQPLVCAQYSAQHHVLDHWILDR